MLLRIKYKYYLYFLNFYIKFNLKNFIIIDKIFITFYLNFIKKIYNYFFIFNKKYFRNNFLIIVINFLSYKLIYLFINLFTNIFFKNIFININFLKYKYYLKIGLSFKKKFSRLHNLFRIFIGHRHWVLFKMPKINYYFNIRRRNILLLTSNKNLLNYFLAMTHYLRKETVFKTKGLMFRRVWIRKKIPRGILFARRIKFFVIKLKLSKKQKFI